MITPFFLSTYSVRTTYVKRNHTLKKCEKAPAIAADAFIHYTSLCSSPVFHAPGIDNFDPS